MKKSAEQLFFEKIDFGEPHECWEWQASRATKTEHGTYKYKGKGSNASRFALEFAIGRNLKPNEQACHTCNNPPCCNPNHLYVGSAKSNMDDMRRAGNHGGRGKRFTHYKRGHEFTPENTLINVRGAQSCRECDRIRQKQRYENNPELQEKRRETVRRSKLKRKMINNGTWDNQW